MVESKSGHRGSVSICGASNLVGSISRVGGGGPPNGTEGYPDGAGRYAMRAGEFF